MSSLPKHKTNATDERIVQILCDAQAAMQGKVKVGSPVRGTVQGVMGQFRQSCDVLVVYGIHSHSNYDTRKTALTVCDNKFTCTVPFK